MNVKQLIEALEAVEDKSRPVSVRFDCGHGVEPVDYVSMTPTGVFINGHDTDLDEEEL